ncbi:hypothetical protein GCM10008967_00360 [Bacillus carboniphilus]|uniref:Phage protein n=1 Tax=Bacillus carboniphilus TaxID=86663 RepID=A0ABN0VP57_9BACI
MSLNSLILSTLQPLGIPVDFQTYEGESTTYITFFEYNQRSALNADDDEDITSHSIQLDVWSKGNYNNIVQQTKQLLKGIGFRRTHETEFYEEETKIYHKVLRFSYSKEEN